MDKKQLNREIVLCRSVVKRAKVCVIRKLIKKIKILRACKKEKLREKKLKKARRLAAEIHEMKGLQPDYVTKFALITENYVPTGSNTKLKRKRNACSKLVKHKDLIEKINAIRNKFSNWREELPPLLELAEKKVKVKDEEKNEENVTIDGNSNHANNEINLDVNTNISEDVPDTDNDASEVSADDEHEDKSIEEEDIKEKINVEIKSDNISKPPRLKVSKLTTESDKGENTKKKGKKKNTKNAVEQKKKNKSNVEIIEPEDVDDIAPVKEKVDDPFFINKKVAVPKLLLSDNEDVFNTENKDRKRLSDGSFKNKTKSNNNEVMEKTVKKPEYEKRKLISTDELHPSWKAKKIQMIKPFEGKKIKFE